MNIDKYLPETNPINITSGVDRYGFSSVLAKRLNIRHVPRSFANWVHGWCWWTMHTAELLSCHKLPKDTSIIVTNAEEKKALISDGFENVRAGGIPFAYVAKQHSYRTDRALLAFPPHTAEVEKFSNDHKEYFDYLESIKKDYEDIYVSIYYLDIDTPMHFAALHRGLKVVQGANPSDANGLIRVRSILDSFKYVTSNTMGSHMLYALYSECNFSFSGPFYALDESVFLSNGNPHKHTTKYINEMLRVVSHAYVKEQFPHFFQQHPSMGIQALEYAVEAIGEKYILQPSDIKDALGWSLTGQVIGYAKGAKRRLIRSWH
jgi:hypothetical protein